MFDRAELAEADSPAYHAIVQIEHSEPQRSSSKACRKAEAVVHEVPEKSELAAAPAK